METSDTSLKVSLEGKNEVSELPLSQKANKEDEASSQKASRIGSNEDMTALCAVADPIKESNATHPDGSERPTPSSPSAEDIAQKETGTSQSGDVVMTESVDPGYEAAEEDYHIDVSKRMSGEIPSYDSASQEETSDLAASQSAANAILLGNKIARRTFELRAEAVAARTNDEVEKLGDDYAYDATGEESQGHTEEEEERPVEVRAPPSEADTERSSGMEEMPPPKEQAETVADGYEATGEESQEQTDEEMPPPKDKAEHFVDGYDATAEENTEEEDDRQNEPRESVDNENSSVPTAQIAGASEKLEGFADGYVPTGDESQGHTEEDEERPVGALKVESKEPAQSTDQAKKADVLADGYLPTGDESQGHTEDEERHAEAMDTTEAAPAQSEEQKGNKSARHVGFAPLHKATSHLDEGYMPDEAEEHTEDDIPKFNAPKSKLDGYLGGESQTEEDEGVPEFPTDHEEEETKQQADQKPGGQMNEMSERPVLADTQSLSGMSAADEQTTGVHDGDSSDLAEDVDKETLSPIPPLPSQQGSSLQDFAMVAQQQNEQHQKSPPKKNPTPIQFRSPASRQTSAITFDDDDDDGVEEEHQEEIVEDDDDEIPDEEDDDVEAAQLFEGENSIPEKTVQEGGESMTAENERESTTFGMVELPPIPEDDMLDEDQAKETGSPVSKPIATRSARKLRARSTGDDGSVSSAASTEDLATKTTPRRQTRSMSDDEQNTSTGVGAKKKQGATSGKKREKGKNDGVSDPDVESPAPGSGRPKRKRGAQSETDDESTTRRSTRKRKNATAADESADESVRRSGRKRKSTIQSDSDDQNLTGPASGKKKSTDGSDQEATPAATRRRTRVSRGASSDIEENVAPVSTRRRAKAAASETEEPQPAAKKKSAPVKRSRKGRKKTGEDDEESVTSVASETKHRSTLAAKGSTRSHAKSQPSEAEDTHDESDVSHAESVPTRRSTRLRKKREKPLAVALAASKMMKKTGLSPSARKGGSESDED
uniref:Uncharacterized protein n=1 Tax=Entomoneis paludosa TaxID=265537 RepID=A0A7S2YG13_9STRA